MGLDKMLLEEELSTAALLVMANKQDLPNAMTPKEMTEKLGLLSIRQRPWYIQTACATTGAVSTRGSIGSPGLCLASGPELPQHIFSLYRSFGFAERVGSVVVLEWGGMCLPSWILPAYVGILVKLQVWSASLPGLLAHCTLML